MLWSPLLFDPQVPGRQGPEKGNLCQVGAAFHGQAYLQMNCR